MIIHNSSCDEEAANIVGIILVDTLSQVCYGTPDLSLPVTSDKILIQCAIDNCLKIGCESIWFVANNINDLKYFKNLLGDEIKNELAQEKYGINSTAAYFLEISTGELVWSSIIFIHNLIERLTTWLSPSVFLIINPRYIFNIEVKIKDILTINMLWKLNDEIVCQSYLTHSNIARLPAPDVEYDVQGHKIQSFSDYIKYIKTL